MLVSLKVRPIGISEGKSVELAMDLLAHFDSHF